MAKSSTISGFYKLPPKERLAIIKEFADLTDEEVLLLQNSGALPLEVADHMVET
jgi:hydroxymethylglutaryl-CoA reductase